MKIRALIADTFREIYSKKVILAIIVIEVIALVITGLIIFSDGMQETYVEMRKGTVAVDTADAEAGFHADGHDTSDAAGAKNRWKEIEARAKDSAAKGSAAKETALDDSASMATDSALLEVDTSVQGLVVPIPDSVGDTTRRGGSKAFETAPPAGGVNGTAGGPAVGGLRNGGEVAVEDMVRGEETFYGTAIVMATLFLGIFATAGIVPSMMEKGTIDLLLSKPISRTTLLFGRLLGGILAVLVNLVAFVTAIWALYGFASGVWYLPFLGSTIAIAFFAYLVVLSGVLLMNVMSESWILPLCIAYVHVMVLAPTLANREETLFTIIHSSIARGILDGLHYMLPQTAVLATNSLRDAIVSSTVISWEPFIQGAIFAAIATTLAVRQFNRKDF